MKKSYYASYQKFLEKNFPTTSINKQLDVKEQGYLKEIVDNIQVVLFHLDLVRRGQISKQEEDFVNECRQLLLKILLTLPLNDEYLIQVLLRSFSESMLRLIVMKSPNSRSTFQEVRRYSFTSIKKAVLKDGYLFKRKRDFDYLYDLFSVSSRSLHDPIDNVKLVASLNEQINLKISHRSLAKKTKQIRKIELKAMSYLFRLRYQSLSIEDLTNIKKMLSKNEQMIFYGLP
ncbi:MULTISPECIES: hypothetical protein [Levilactobacillus]|uniref:hypothetical protein n=1 Tax=Levilactobacillus TaxID=2767886 RepID=UPI0037565333